MTKPICICYGSGWQPIPPDKRGYTAVRPCGCGAGRKFDTSFATATSGERAAAELDLAAPLASPVAGGE